MSTGALEANDGHSGCVQPIARRWSGGQADGSDSWQAEGAGDVATARLRGRGFFVGLLLRSREVARGGGCDAALRLLSSAPLASVLAVTRATPGRYQATRYMPPPL